jgi:hypothetical protein
MISLATLSVVIEHVKFHFVTGVIAASAILLVIYGQLDCELVGRSSGTRSPAAGSGLRTPRVHVGRVE